MSLNLISARQIGKGTDCDRECVRTAAMIPVSLNRVICNKSIIKENKTESTLGSQREHILPKMNIYQNNTCIKVSSRYKASA